MRIFNSIMNYLVLRPNGAQATISIVPEDTVLDLPYRGWALKTGKQILFANDQMHKVLESHYMMGAYTDRALYGYSYEELDAILVSKLGPSDEDRYKAAVSSIQQAKPSFNQSVGRVWQVGLWRLLEFLITTFCKGVKFLVVMLIIPFLISFISKRK